MRNKQVSHHLPVFLTAEWRKLAMINYEINPDILRPFLPVGTELDFFQNKCLVSMIGFLFTKTRLKGIPVPFHQTFTEVNLRFYVTRKLADGTIKRGAVFIKEIVPKFAISLVANLFYGEHYETMPCKHKWQIDAHYVEVRYDWQSNMQNHLFIKAKNQPYHFENGSLEDYITEHYWGYTKLKNNKTSEYGVEHPKWLIYPVVHHDIKLNFEELYGKSFSILNTTPVHSVLLAEGSEVVVRKGTKF